MITALAGAGFFLGRATDNRSETTAQPPPTTVTLAPSVYPTAPAPKAVDPTGADTPDDARAGMLIASCPAVDLPVGQSMIVKPLPQCPAPGDAHGTGISLAVTGVTYAQLHVQGATRQAFFSGSNPSYDDCQNASRYINGSFLDAGDFVGQSICATASSFMVAIRVVAVDNSFGSVSLSLTIWQR
ncbi:hypothetical protein Ntsu_54720 [Nocardia sp. IFM 10818]